MTHDAAFVLEMAAVVCLVVLIVAIVAAVAGACECEPVAAAAAVHDDVEQALGPATLMTYNEARKAAGTGNKGSASAPSSVERDEEAPSCAVVPLTPEPPPLVIPDKFAEHFSDKIERNITLESLGGFTFDVQVAKNLGRIVLQSGWKSFVSAHDLKMMDFLVFKYDGMSRMKVLIFDPSGCEKVPSCFVTKNAITGERKREEPIVVSSGYANLPMKLKAPETKKKSRKQTDRSRISMNASSSLSNSSGGMTSSEDDEAYSIPSYVFPQGTRLDSMQKKKVKERLRAICSENPIYVCAVKKTNISGRSQSLDFSGKYACPPLWSRVVILQCHGKSWEVMCRIQVSTSKRKFKRLSTGWSRFARDNNLQLGDICLFEPLKKTKKYSMNVHIIRKE